MTISLCMIVRNEADRLPACLASVEGLADQIIVLDTGSTDQTAAVAQAQGAEVHTFAWNQDFAAARNAALEKATGDWILVLDADETLQPAILPVLKGIDQGQGVADIPAEHLLLVNLLRLEVGAQQSPYTLVSRFFRNRPDLRFARSYHETVDDSVVALQTQEPHWQVATLDAIALHHQGYQADAIARQNKFERAKAIMAAYLTAHPEDAYICNKLGALYGQEGDWAKALPLLERGLATASSDPLTRYELYYHRGLAHRQLQQLDQAEQDYHTALDQPLLPKLKLGAAINLGSLLKQQGRLPEAIAQFEQAIAMDPDCAIAHFNLGVAHRAQGYLDPAIAAYRRAIELQPNYPEAYQNLGVALFKLGKLPECLQAFSLALRLYEQSDPQAAQALRAGIKKLGIV
ncbi:MAG: tetratricopeptide repeat protein [Cyanobacteria bacterium Co-bin13]|nr:tetratricopeptide repeat protein [Cyanobacteria bacterium Co-bin13]